MFSDDGENVTYLPWLGETISIFDGDNGTLMQTLEAGSGTIWGGIGAQFSHDNELIIAPLVGLSPVRFIDRNTGIVLQEIHTSSPRVMLPVLSPDSSEMLVSFGMSGTIGRIDLSTTAITEAHAGSIVLSPDDRWMVFRRKENTDAIVLVDRMTGEEKTILTLTSGQQFRQDRGAIVFSPDSQRIVLPVFDTESATGFLQVYDLGTGILSEPFAHTENRDLWPGFGDDSDVMIVDVSTPKGQSDGTDTGAGFIWDLRADRVVGILPEQFLADFAEFAVDPSGSVVARAAVPGPDGPRIEVLSFDPESQQLRSQDSVRFTGHTSNVDGIAIDATG